MQVEADGKEEHAIAVYWITGGIERCRVGFLPRYLVKHEKDYDGKIAQVTTLLQGDPDKEARAKNHQGGGVCKATMLVVDVPSKEPPKKKNTTHNKKHSDRE